jgi:hypothetical protein
MTTKQKRLAWVCLIVSPFVLGGAAFCLSVRDPITQANCDKIKKGMTLKEVVVILGSDCRPSSWGPWGLRSYVWRGSRGIISVSFQVFKYPSHPFQELQESFRLGPIVQGIHYLSFFGPLVESAQFLPSESETILEKMRNWLGW